MVTRTAAMTITTTTTTTTTIITITNRLGIGHVSSSKLRYGYYLVGATLLTSCISQREPASSGGAKVEYLCFQEDSAERVSERLNLATRHGWRLVSGGGGDSAIWCLERETRSN